MACTSIHNTTAYTALARWTLVSGLVLALSARAAAEDPAPADFEISMGPFDINDADPESSVPTPEQAAKYPLEMGYLMMGLTERAEAATKKGNHAQAARYWTALAKGAPDRAVGFRKACQSYATAKEWDKAGEFCRTALGRGGATVKDQLAYVSVMFARPGPLEGKSLEDVTEVIAAIEEPYSTSEAGKQRHVELLCRLAVNQEDEKLLEQCVASMQTRRANDSSRILYGTMLAARQGDWDKAEQIVRDAEKAGLPATIANKTREELEARRSLQRSVAWNRVASHWGPVGGIALALGALTLAFARRRNKARLA